MTEKESQLLKNHIMRKGASKSRKRYICDLCIRDYETLINTTEEVNSLPWYIEQCHSSVKGAAVFTEEGDMEIWLFYARTPQAVGLKPRSNIRLKVKASVVKLADDKEPLFIAEENWNFDENIIDFDDSWGLEVGCIKCANVADKGLISDDGTIVIGFEIQIL